MVMKKVIDGKLYDTNTGIKVIAMDNGKYSDDFNNYNATIYRTKKGALFIFEDGGAYSKMGRTLGSGASGGSSDMKVLTDEQAVEMIQEWHADRYISVSECQEALENLGVKIEEA